MKATLLKFTIPSLILMLSLPAIPQEQQNWEISLLDQAGQVTSTAPMHCIQGGACDAGPWTILRPDQFGCLYELDFSVQFSQSSVRMLLFQRAMSSTCSNIMMTLGTGTGYADAPYPTANNASGEITLGFEIRQQLDENDVLIPDADDQTRTRSQGTTRWLARRVAN